MIIVIIALIMLLQHEILEALFEIRIVIMVVIVDAITIIVAIVMLLQR